MGGKAAKGSKAIYSTAKGIKAADNALSAYQYSKSFDKLRKTEYGIQGLASANGFSEYIIGKDMFGNELSDEKREQSLNEALAICNAAGVGLSKASPYLNVQSKNVKVGTNKSSLQTVKYGDHIARGHRGRKELKPNVRYVNEEGYKYTTDELGRIVDVEADQLVLKAGVRNKYAQRNVGREDRLPDDDGGHLIATQFNGLGDIGNLVPQNSQINRSGGEWYKMEQTWVNALREEPPRNVSVRVNPVYSGHSLRPDKFEVLYKIEGKEIKEQIIKNKAGG